MTLLIIAFAVLLIAVALWPTFALTANREVPRFVDQELRSFKVKGSSTIYKGGYVGLDAATGYARALVAGDTFLGIAYEECDNSAGSDGDKTVRVFTQGDFQVALSGAALTDIGSTVYASADDTATLTSTDNSAIGTMVDLLSTGQIVLRISTF